jgi:hypothetical protein
VPARNLDAIVELDDGGGDPGCENERPRYITWGGVIGTTNPFTQRSYTEWGKAIEEKEETYPERGFSSTHESTVCWTATEEDCKMAVTAFWI